MCCVICEFCGCGCLRAFVRMPSLFFYFVLSATVCLFGFPCPLCSFVNLGRVLSGRGLGVFLAFLSICLLFQIGSKVYEIGIAITRSGNFGAFPSAPSSSQPVLPLSSSSSFSSLICLVSSGLGEQESSRSLSHGRLLACAVQCQFLLS